MSEYFQLVDGQVVAWRLRDGSWGTKEEYLAEMAEPITVRRGDLYLLLICASSYHSRLPHGIIPPSTWEALDDDLQQRILADERGQL